MKNIGLSLKLRIISRLFFFSKAEQSQEEEAKVEEDEEVEMKERTRFRKLAKSGKEEEELH